MAAVDLSTCVTSFHDVWLRWIPQWHLTGMTCFRPTEDWKFNIRTKLKIPWLTESQYSISLQTQSTPDKKQQVLTINSIIMANCREGLHSI